MIHRCLSCINCYRSYQVDRYGKTVAVYEHCGSKRNRKIMPPVTECKDYMRALHLHSCGYCGKALVEPPMFVTKNHAFCSEEHRHTYLTRKDEKDVPPIIRRTSPDEISLEEFKKL